MRKNDFIDGDSAYVISDRSSRRYFSGVDVAEGTVVLGKDYIAYLTDARYFDAFEKKLKKSGIIPVLYKDGDSLKNFLSEKNAEKLFVEYDKTTVRDYEELKSFRPFVGDCSSAVKNLRAIKTDEEIGYIKRACDITNEAYYKTLGELKVGVTESEIKEVIEKNMKELGAEDVAFDAIVAFGANGAVPHHESGDTSLKNNSSVLIDVGCKINGYCSDMTRTAFFGKPKPEFMTAYGAVLSANLICEDRIRAGMKCSEADAIAREVLAKKGYGEKFTHSLGHGVGLDIHENPYLSRRSDETICENQAFTIEPGVYEKGAFGIRMEDTVIIKNGVVVRLFSDDKNLIVI